VDTAPAILNHPARASLPVRSAWVILLVATLYICYFSHLGAIGFVGPDESRYAWVARDMAETGDWVTPHLYGKPWFEKPPLYYWGAALSFKLFGISEAAARLPSAVSALLATLVLAWLALRLYSSETARWLLLLLPTTVGMIGFSHAAATDMPFSAMLSIAMVCAAAVIGLTRTEHTPILPRTPWLALLFFGFFLGLAVLAKGPAAIILAGGAIFFWALFTKRWRDAFRLLHPAALASFCLAALPWYILCARRNPDFFRVFFIEHNFKRYLTPEFQHIQPFWFYAPVLLVAFLPWTALLLWSAVEGAIHLWRTRRTSESTCYLLSWAGFCVVFFSFSQSKLPGYILPVLPAIGLMLGHSLTGMAKIHRQSFRASASVMALVFLMLFVFSKVSATRYELAVAPREAGGAILGLMSVANALLAILNGSHRETGRLLLRAASCILPILLAVTLASSLLSSYFRIDPSGRTIARELQLHNISANKLAIGRMSRGQRYSLNFYLHEEIKDWNWENSTKEFVLTDAHSCGTLIPIPFACEQVPLNGPPGEPVLYHVVMAGSVQGSADRRQAE
jgi:4-amino-4-deoxy-L-arabinose transferase-like glycosyltransferase